VLTAAGDLAAAAEVAGVAVSHFIDATAPIAEGTTRHLLATLHAKTGRHQEMRFELGRAKAIYSASSATWLTTALARDELRFAARLPRPRQSQHGTGLATLTGRELEVVELATAGLTNREIAERLYLSTKTVETHLSRAFTKLDVRSRVDLVRRVTGS
jgi:DNA-binding NarL/FixJ family response regulator